MKTIIFRPSVDSKSYKEHELEEAFKKYKLIDKTVSEDRIVYIFNDEHKAE